MNIRVCSIIVGLMVLFQVVSAAAQELSLEQVLTKEEATSLGIATMSPERRTALMRSLLRIYRQGLAAGSSQSTGGASAIESQVDGEFNGWEGETIVKLMNGQIWEQSEYHYEYHYAYMPKIIIYKTGGTYKMKIDGTSSAVGVRQLR